MRLEEVGEEDREDDGTEGDARGGETDDEGALAAEVGREDGEAGGEHEAEGELQGWREESVSLLVAEGKERREGTYTHDQTLTAEDLRVRLCKAQPKKPGEPPDATEEQLVLEEPAIEEDAGREGRGESDEEVDGADHAEC